MFLTAAFRMIFKTSKGYIRISQSDERDVISWEIQAQKIPKWKSFRFLHYAKNSGVCVLGGGKGFGIKIYACTWNSGEFSICLLWWWINSQLRFWEELGCWYFNDGFLHPEQRLATKHVTFRLGSFRSVFLAAFSCRIIVPWKLVQSTGKTVLLMLPNTQACIHISCHHNFQVKRIHASCTC